MTDTNNVMTFTHWMKELYQTPFFQDIIQKSKEASATKDFVPQPKYLFRAYDDSVITPDQVRVMIIMDETIPDPVIADGFALSSRNPNQRHPGLNQLLNILYHSMYKHVDINIFRSWFPITNIIPWIKKGILPVNVHLSTRSGIPQGHRYKIDWLEFTKFMVRKLSDYRNDPKQPIQFILIGEEANKLAGHIKGAHHLLLQYPKLTSGPIENIPPLEFSLFHQISRFYTQFYPDQCEKHEFYFRDTIDESKFNQMLADESVRNLLPSSKEISQLQNLNFNPKFIMLYGPNYKMK